MVCGVEWMTPHRGAPAAILVGLDARWNVSVIISSPLWYGRCAEALPFKAWVVRWTYDLITKVQGDRYAVPAIQP
jgi:hypothetical protein